MVTVDAASQLHQTQLKLSPVLPAQATLAPQQQLQVNLAQSSVNVANARNPPPPCSAFFSGAPVRPATPSANCASQNISANAVNHALTGSLPGFASPVQTSLSFVQNRVAPVNPPAAPQVRPLVATGHRQLPAFGSFATKAKPVHANDISSDMLSTLLNGNRAIASTNSVTVASAAACSGSVPGHVIPSAAPVSTTTTTTTSLNVVTHSLPALVTSTPASLKLSALVSSRATSSAQAAAPRTATAEREGSACDVVVPFKWKRVVEEGHIVYYRYESCAVYARYTT